MMAVDQTMVGSFKGKGKSRASFSSAKPKEKALAHVDPCKSRTTKKKRCNYCRKFGMKRIESENKKKQQGLAVSALQKVGFKI